MIRLAVFLMSVLLAAAPALANQDREIDRLTRPTNAVALTLHGQPVPLTTDVYTLSPPAVAPQQVDPPAETDPPMSKARRVLIGAIVGATAGCAVLAALNSSYGESGENPAFCLIGAGIGAVPGALLAAAVHRADP